MEKLILGRPLRRQEVDIVDNQTPGASDTERESRSATGSHRIEKAIGECLGGELSNIQVGVGLRRAWPIPSSRCVLPSPTPP